MLNNHGAMLHHGFRADDGDDLLEIAERATVDGVHVGKGFGQGAVALDVGARDQAELHRRAFNRTRRLALQVRKHLEELNLTTWVKTSGRTGASRSVCRAVSISKCQPSTSVTA